MRAFLVVVMLTVGLLAPATAFAQASSCQFVLGFKTIADMIPSTVGSCLNNEYHNATNGDGLQNTTGGLLVWRKADNWTAFTDGYHTWVNGPAGLQERLNTQRFAWEANPDGLEVVGSSTGTVSTSQAANLLNTFSSDVFGRTFTYTRTSASTTFFFAVAGLPSSQSAILKQEASAAGVSAYGQMAQGAELVLAAIGTTATSDQNANVAVGSLGDVVVNGFPAAASQAAALALVNQVAPKLASTSWTVQSAARGAYVFTASGPITINTSNGPVTANAGAVATVRTTGAGTSSVAVLVGIGNSATLVAS